MCVLWYYELLNESGKRKQYTYFAVPIAFTFCTSSRYGISDGEAGCAESFLILTKAVLQLQTKNWIDMCIAFTLLMAWFFKSGFWSEAQSLHCSKTYLWKFLAHWQLSCVVKFTLIYQLSVTVKLSVTDLKGFLEFKGNQPPLAIHNCNLLKDAALGLKNVPTWVANFWELYLFWPNLLKTMAAILCTDLLIK